MKLPSPIVFSNSFCKNHRESINNNFDCLMEVIITPTIYLLMEMESFPMKNIFLSQDFALWLDVLFSSNLEKFKQFSREYFIRAIFSVFFFSLYLLVWSFMFFFVYLFIEKKGKVSHHGITCISYFSRSNLQKSNVIK